MEDHQGHEHTEEPKATGWNYYRKHTFAKKGPNRREVRMYQRSREIFLPMPPGSKPKTGIEMDQYFAGHRMQRFPEEHAANIEVLQRQLDKMRRRAARNHKH